MFNEYLIFAKEKISGKVFKSALIYFSVPFSIFLFLLTLICTFIFFFYDTTLLDSLGVFENELYLGVVCAFFTSELIFLFYLMFYAQMKKHSYFSDLKVQFDFALVCRFIAVQTLSFIRKTILAFLFLSPAIISALISYFLIDKGVTQSILIILISATSIMTASGFVFYFIYIQKYSLVKYVCLDSRFLSVSDIFKESFCRTDGKLLMMCRLKISNILRFALSLFVIPAFYYLPLIEFYKYSFLVHNEKPYEQNSAHTEKSVVFYFSPVREN